MRRSLLVLVGLAAVAASAPVRVAADPVPLETLLRRAAFYVAHFIDDFSRVACEETYVQEANSPMPTIVVSGTGRAGTVISGLGSLKRRDLKSEFLVVDIDGSRVWYPFRDVFEVDRVAVRDRDQRLSKLFLRPDVTTKARAQQISDESSRYNLGTVERTVNNPIFPLLFLFDDNQKRLRFTYTASTGSVEAGVLVVAFTEDSRPTLIKGPPGQMMPAHGRFWIEEATGRVVKGEILVTRVDITASLTVTYGIDERLQVNVPLEMRESYTTRGGTIKAIAKYGKFRQFSVDASEEIGDPITDKSETTTLPK